MTPRATVFRELDGGEIDAVLERNRVGRIAFLSESGVDIEPLSYVWIDGLICGRTTPGTKLEAIAHRPWVAFEVDEVESPFEWTSVVLKGALYLVPPGPSVQHQETYARTLETIRTAEHSALTEGDLTPERAMLFRIYVDQRRGRSARIVDARRASPDH